MEGINVKFILGQDIRVAVNNIDNLKPNLLNQINQRMDEVEEINIKVHFS